MKNLLFLLLLSSFPLPHIFGQQNVRIKNSKSSLKFLAKQPGKPLTTVRTVSVEVEYWATFNSDTTLCAVNFGIGSATMAPQSSPAIKMSPYEISSDSFELRHKTMVIDVPVTIAAMPEYSPEYFTICLKATDGTIESETGVVGVTIEEESAKIEKEKEKNPIGLTYMNGVNFDFEGSNGASYVGHLNVYQPNLISVGKKGIQFGLNMGILKINFSRNDSLNNSYYYYENTLINPLDSVKTGTRYLRQYNQISTVSKNVTWSFYFQPTITLYKNDKVRIMFHLLTEFYVNRWNTNATITNFSQDSSTITDANLGLITDSISYLNKFHKSITEEIKSSSTSTDLNFNTGGGLSFDITPWEGAQIFINHTSGVALRYARPTSVSSKDLTYIEGKKQNAAGHISRFSLAQKLSSNLQLIVGVEVRGLYGYSPTWASYIGLNLGLEGVKKLIND